MKVYRQHTERFFRWAQERGFTLDTIDVVARAAYEAQLARTTMSIHLQNAAVYVTGIYQLFRHLVAAGVLAEQSHVSSHPNDPTLPLPQTATEWQTEVDAAYVGLALDSMEQYGLVKGGPQVKVDRCQKILDLRQSYGVTPNDDAFEEFVADLNADADPEPIAAEKSPGTRAT